MEFVAQRLVAFSAKIREARIYGRQGPRPIPVEAAKTDICAIPRPRRAPKRRTEIVTAVPNGALNAATVLKDAI